MAKNTTPHSNNPDANKPGVTSEGVQDATAAPKPIQIDSKVDTTFDPTVSGAVIPGPADGKGEMAKSVGDSADMGVGTGADSKVAATMAQEEGAALTKGITRFQSTREEGSGFTFMGVRSTRSTERPGHLEWLVPNDKAKGADDNFFVKRGRVRKA